MQRAHDYGHYADFNYQLRSLDTFICLLMSIIQRNELTRWTLQTSGLSFRCLRDRFCFPSRGKVAFIWTFLKKIN